GPPGAAGPGDMLLEDGVEVRAAETEGADAGPADAAGRFRPVAPFGVDPERRVLEIDGGARPFDPQTRRQDLVVQGQRRLEETGGPGGGLQVPDVRLDGTEGDRGRRRPGGGEDRRQRLDLDRVADAGRGAVALHVGDR